MREVVQRLQDVVKHGPVPNLVGDCAGVVSIAENWELGLGGKSTWAGLWKDVVETHQRATGLRGGPRILKTKAHRTIDQALAENDLEAFYGNRAVDGIAKKCAEDSLAPKTELWSFDATAKQVCTILRGAARVLALWPDAESLFGTLERRATVRRANARAAVEKHGWYWCDGLWRCRYCFATRAEGRDLRAAPHCGVTAVGTMRALAQRHETQHRIWLSRPADGTGALVAVCVACGCYAERLCRQLQRSCEPKAEPTDALRRFTGTPAFHPRVGDGRVMVQPWAADGGVGCLQDIVDVRAPEPRTILSKNKKQRKRQPVPQRIDAAQAVAHRQLMEDRRDADSDGEARVEVGGNDVGGFDEFDAEEEAARAMHAEALARARRKRNEAIARKQAIERARKAPWEAFLSTGADSTTQRPVTVLPRLSEAIPHVSSATASDDDVTVSDSQASTSRRVCAATKQRARLRAIDAQDRERTETAVRALADQLTPQEGPSAASRLAALRSRVRANSL